MAMLKLLLFVLPLGLDTFAVSAALGASGIPKRERLRISLLLSGFEIAMPVIGLLLGQGLDGAVGAIADYLAPSSFWQPSVSARSAQTTRARQRRCARFQRGVDSRSSR